MSWARLWKGRIYSLLPSRNVSWHGKRRKGLGYRQSPKPPMECQIEQDRIFLQNFLGQWKSGTFWEVGCGDGTTGSCTLVLEQDWEWTGLLVEPFARAARLASGRRKAAVRPDLPRGGEAAPDLVFIRRPAEFPGFWETLASRRVRPRWLIVENASASPVWSQHAEKSGYRLRWFFHDDEYLEAQA